MNIKKYFFSIIELMTVIMIILLISSLIIPTFSRAIINSKTVVCKSQLRQIGSLISSYVSDNGGYFPYYSGGDIPTPSIGNNQLYQYWNGHLLPYLSMDLPDKYSRYAMVTKVGTTRYAASQLGGPPNPPPPLKDRDKMGWSVVDDALNKGGYNDLRTYICPDIHQRAFDVAVSIDYNGVRIPRISQLCFQGFFDKAGYDYGMTGGIPTTYLANSFYFGYRGDGNSGMNNSLRIDQIKDLGNKVILVEGGVANPFSGSNGEQNAPYYHIYAYSAFTGGQLMGRFDKGSVGIQKLSYVHDDIGSFWVMTSGWYSYYFPSFWWGEVDKGNFAAKFNDQFRGKAMMVMNSQEWSFDASIGYDLVSFSNPYKDEKSLAGGTIFDNYLKNNPAGTALRDFIPYVDEPNDYHYLVGNMNVLMGDNSVSLKDNAWICNNRLQISREH